MLDRSLIITLKRIGSDKIVTEDELWEEFEKDRPKILGTCFKVSATALNNTEKVQVKYKIRMADFHVACIKVGRALEIPEEEVFDILWENQRNVNQCTLDEDVVALCVIELMQGKKEYVNFVSGLLIDLLEIAQKRDAVNGNLQNTKSFELKAQQSKKQPEIGVWD